MYNPTYQNVENPMLMEMILNVLCMALCNKVPKGVVSFKMDTVYSKIKLSRIPKGLEIERREVIEDGEVTNVFEKNTNERALVRVLVPRRKLTLSEIAAEDQNRRDAFGNQSPSAEKEGNTAENSPREQIQPAQADLEPLEEKYVDQD